MLSSLHMVVPRSWRRVAVASLLVGLALCLERAIAAAPAGVVARIKARRAPLFASPDKDLIERLGAGARADDAVRRAILSAPRLPLTIYDVHRRLDQLGGVLATHIVNNRGHDNPEPGSFSFFESYTGPMEGGTVKEGELFIGFFSERQGNSLAVQQSFQPGLMIELIAWDYAKQVFNFWELIGTGSTSQWNYRGDTNDILADIGAINSGAPGVPIFGQRLRCSGCHTLGTPIMKELEGPNNDWWTTQRKLKLGTMSLTPGPGLDDPRHHAARLFKRAQDSSNLARLVKLSIDRLFKVSNPVGVPAIDVRLRMRSLFHTMEMNLASDTIPLEERGSGAILIPTAFFVDRRLTPGAPPVALNRDLYLRCLKLANMRFAREEAPGLVDAHHAFLVPTRSYVDDAMLDALVRRNLLDDELICDVLAVDFTRPVFSPIRAGMFKYMPDRAQHVADLRQKLTANLRRAGASDPAATELLANITDPLRSAAFHRQRAREYLENKIRANIFEKHAMDWLRIASQRRLEVGAAPTAQNPRGTILEPGFRVIFPVDDFGSQPGQWRLDPSTGLIIR